MITKWLGLIALLVTLPTKATFYIDYQGLNPHPVKPPEEKSTTPDGYRLLTDGLQGLIFEVGERPVVEKTSNFAADVAFKFAIGAIMPEGWSAYVDENISMLKNVSFSAQDEPWLNVLARVGTQFGYQYVVDWQRKMVQVSLDAYFSEPNPNAPVTVQGENGEQYYIYKTRQAVDQGVVIVDGQVVPMRVKR